MKELLIFRINDIRDLNVYYKDRDMKDFVNITTVNYKSGLLGRVNGAKFDNTTLNTDIIEYIIHNELPRFEDVRPELARFILFLYHSSDDARAVTIKDFMKRYIENDFSVWDSHIVEFDKELFKTNIYFEFILNKTETIVNFYYNNKKSNVNLISCTLEEFINKKYEIYELNLGIFIKELKLNISVGKVLKVLKRTITNIKNITKSELLDDISTSITKKESINFYDIKSK